MWVNHREKKKIVEQKLDLLHFTTYRLALSFIQIHSHHLIQRGEANRNGSRPRWNHFTHLRSGPRTHRRVLLGVVRRFANNFECNSGTSSILDELKKPERCLVGLDVFLEAHYFVTTPLAGLELVKHFENLTEKTFLLLAVAVILIAER